MVCAQWRRRLALVLLNHKIYCSLRLLYMYLGYLKKTQLEGNWAETTLAHERGQDMFLQPHHKSHCKITNEHEASYVHSGVSSSTFTK